MSNNILKMFPTTVFEKTIKKLGKNYKKPEKTIKKP
jgi:hypothetical protein